MKYGQTKAFVILFSLLLGHGAEAAVTDRLRNLQQIGSTESVHEGTDLVALDSQRKAVANLKILLRRQNKNSSAYPAMLLKLAEFKRELADIVFRVEGAKAYREKTRIDLREYNRIVDESVVLLDEVIRDYPNFLQLSQALLLRAQAHESRERYPKATEDFLRIVTQFPKTREEYVSYLMLAEIATNDNRLADVVRFLNAIKSQKQANNYGYVLYRLAWAHFKLQKIDLGIEHAQLLIQESIIQSKSSRTGLAITSLRNDLFEEMPTLLLRWYETQAQRPEAAQVYSTFNRVQGKAGREYVENALVRFGRLLRAHDHTKELVDWKNLALKEAPRSKAAFELLLIVAEDQLFKMQHKDYLSTVKEVVAFGTSNRQLIDVEPARASFTSAAERLQSQIAKNPSLKASSELLLENVYEALLVFTPPLDPVAFRIHFNLGELLASRGDRAKAATNFLWIFQRRSELKKLNGVAIDGLDSGLKALRLIYDELKVAKLVPEKVQPKALSNAAPPAKPAILLTWEKCLNLVYKAFNNKLDNEQLDFFVFENFRILYGAGHQREVISQITELLLDHPETRFAQAMASLVVDTYMASSDWKEAEQSVRIFIPLPSIEKNKSFVEGLAAVGADAAYKLVENAFNSGAFAAVLSSEKTLNTRYEKSARASDWRSLIARSALKVGDSARALDQFSELSGQKYDLRYSRDALVMKAKLEEEKFAYAEAARTLTDYLERFGSRDLKDSQRKELRERILTLAAIGLSGDKLESFYRDRGLCVGDNAVVCERLLGLVFITDRAKSKEAVERVGNDLSNAPIRALLALREDHEDLWASLTKLESVARNWVKLDATTKLVLLPELQRAAQLLIPLDEFRLPGQQNLVADEKVLSQRLDLIQHYQTAAENLINLPNLEVQTRALGSIGRLYADLALELERMEDATKSGDDAAKALAKVLAKSAPSLRETSLQLAERAIHSASTGGMSGKTFQALVDLLPEEKRLRWRAARGRFLASVKEDFSEHVEAIALKQKSLQSREQILQGRLYSQYKDAANNGRWLEASFLIRLLHQRDWISGTGADLLTSGLIARVGALPEALAVLENAKQKLSAPDRAKANLLLISAFTEAQALDRSKEILQELDKAGSKVLDSDSQDQLKELRQKIMGS